MMMLSAIRIALRELRRNILRSALTTLGIVIGVGAVIVMVTLGNGATAKVSADIASMGSNLLTLMPGQRLGPGGSSGGARPFKDSDIEALAQQVPGLAWVAPVSSASTNIVYGNKNRSVSVIGTTNDYFYSGNWRLGNGRWFNDGELQSGRTVCVIGTTVRKELFDGEDPLGARLRLRGVSCEIIGVLASKGRNTFGQDRDDTVLMPLRTFQRRISGVDDVQQVQM